MSQYGVIKYAEGKYGVGTPWSALIWVLEIDWNGDGVYDGNNDALFVSKLTTKRGRDNFIKNDGSGFEPVKEGTFTATLLNTDGRYDPYNEDSPYYPYIRPGVKFKLRVKDTASGVFYPIMVGRIENIKPITGDIETVTITGADAIKELKNTKAFVPVYETIGIDDAVSTLATAIDWQYGTDIQATSDTLRYWWSPGLQRNAYQEFVDLSDLKFGNFFIARDGDLTFYSTQFHASGVAAVIQETDIQHEVQRLQPWEVIRNAVRVNVNPLSLADGVDVWSLPSSIPVSAGEAVTIWASFNYNNTKVPCKAIDPIPSGTGYRAFTNPDESGTDLTADFTVTATAYGETGEIVIDNGSASDGYLTHLSITGDALTSNNLLIVQSINQASIDLYGRRELNINSRWGQDVNLAINTADELSDNLSSAYLYPTLIVTNNPALQFGLELFDKVDLYLTFGETLKLFNLFVSSIEHEWITPNGQITRTIFKFEPVMFAGTFWTFTTTLGITSIFSY